MFRRTFFRRCLRLGASGMVAVGCRHTLLRWGLFPLFRAVADFKFMHPIEAPFYQFSSARVQRFTNQTAVLA